MSFLKGIGLNKDNIKQQEAPRPSFQQNNNNISSDGISRTVTPLFSMPVYHAELGQPDPSVLDFCKSIDYVRYKADNGWVSVNKYVLDAPQLSGLKNLMLREMSIFLHQIISLSDEYEFYINNSWVQKISKGDWTHPHAHENSLISGVYYVNVYEDSGDFLMEKPVTNLNLIPSFLTFNFKEFNVLNSSSWKVKPKNGTLLIMGSHLVHSAGTNSNKKDRFCIPFNAYVRGKFGKDGVFSDLILN